MAAKTSSPPNVTAPLPEPPPGRMEADDENQPKKGNKCVKFFRSAKFKLYCSYGLSAWGDRLWTFALALVLVKIGGDLRLTAVSGLVNGLCVLLFGASVGRWIDATPRLKAARTTLTINNAAVALSAAFLITVLYWDSDLSSTVRALLIGGSIVLCAFNVLAGTGTKIVLTKDWVVVMCGGNKEKLADMNAMLLRLDLTTQIIAPLIAGQIMTSINATAGCVFIAVWNICSYGVEYFCLYRVYTAVPQLAQKHNLEPQVEVAVVTDPDTAQPEGELSPSLVDAIPVDDATVSKRSLCSMFGHGVRQNLSGWKLYYQQDVFNAALCLALIYLTVMGLDGITTGYAYSQGLKENVLGIVRGVGAVTGILGSLAYPRLRAKVGLARTGLFSLTAQLTCLALGIVSIWLPGSPFDPVGYFWGEKSSTSTTSNYWTTPPSTATDFNFNASSNLTTVSWPTNQTHLVTTEATPVEQQMWSIWIFLVSIVLARFGLWMVDLTITQIMQEGIVETERGVVNGVQSSLQRLLDLTKDVLVIALPDPATFGFLIIISFISVFFGFCSYCIYSRKVRGHLLPFYKPVPSYLATA